MLSGFRTVLCAMKASGAYGRALKFQRNGKDAQALDAARHGLALLGKPHVLRDRPWTSSVLALLTIFVEHYANKLGAPGASQRDLADSLQAFKAMAKSPDKSCKNYNDEILYLESRIQRPQD